MKHKLFKYFLLIILITFGRISISQTILNGDFEKFKISIINNYIDSNKIDTIYKFENNLSNFGGEIVNNKSIKCFNSNACRLILPFDLFLFKFCNGIERFEFSQPLDSGKNYTIKAYIKQVKFHDFCLPHNKYLAFKICQNLPILKNNINPVTIDSIPGIVKYLTIDSISTLEWNQVSVEFVSNGNETFLYLGVFPILRDYFEWFKVRDRAEKIAQKYMRLNSNRRKKKIINEIREMFPFWKKSEVSDDILINIFININNYNKYENPYYLIDNITINKQN